MSESEKKRIESIMGKLNEADYHTAEVALAYLNGRNDERARMEYEAELKEKNECRGARSEND